MSILKTLRTALYGSPPSQAYQPSKEGVIDAFDAVVTALTVLSGGIVGSTASVAATLTALTAIAGADGTLGLVYNDPDSTKNGIYHRVSGAWVFTNLLGVGPEGPGPSSEAIDEATALAEAAADIAGVYAATAEIAQDAALVAANYYATIAAGVAATAVGNVFTSDEGGWAWYRRTGTGPFYVLLTNAFTAPVLTVARAGTRAARHADYVCDGTADQVQINAAIAAASAAGGGEVFVASAVYGTSQPVVMQSNVHLRGEATIIRPSVGWVSLADATGHISATAKSNFSVSGFIIDCLTNNIAGNGIEARPDSSFTGTPCSNYDITNNEVRLKKGIHNYGIWSMRGINARVLNNLVLGSYVTGDTFTSGLQQEGIEVFGGSDVLIQGNRVIGLGGAAYNILGNTDTVATNMSNIKVLDNTAEICGRFIQIILTSHSAGRMGGLKNSIISKNTGTDVKVIGMDVQLNSTANDGAAIDFIDNIFSDNVIEMAASGQVAASRGIYFNNQRAAPANINSSGNVVRGNRARGCVNTDAGAHFYLVKMRGISASRNEIVTAPEASGNGRACVLLLCSDFIIENNVFDGARIYGMEVLGCSQGKIERNQVLNWNQYLGGVAGIRVQNSGATESSDLRVIGNSFKSGTLTSVGALAQFTNGSARIEYGGNYYIGTGYTGVVDSYLGTNPTNDAKYNYDTPVGLIDAATVTPNLGIGNNFEWVIGGNRTLTNPINFKRGQRGFIRIIQDGTGSRVITYGDKYWFPGGSAAGGVLSTAAGSIDKIEYVVGGDDRLFCILHKAFAI